MNLMINGKNVDESTIELEDVDSKDYPDFCDAYASSAQFTDGDYLTEAELAQIPGTLINELAHEQFHWNLLLTFYNL